MFALASTTVNGLVEVVLDINIAKNHACVTANGIMNVYSRRLICNTIANFVMVDAQLPNQQKDGEAVDAPV